ncbi:hypothetical protein TCAL_08294 [Tigriopus californicus]|uniref:Uncharacterized protein n=1 Tax=Tigriopus californicus TaxID=6832 RepID=A0A553NF50_TIGCA|nr:uncharacterized protein LOC131887781 [Tigriopus californicus]TRY64066.1 hypothetical protein TCAL_08294 [Tigriopus californicus]|eukprot:TCALIF_08294-PA protein Name:"Protein of unknown function" AED:0.00 eAED:0.00 QI:68/1/1/1/0.33/0.25/4/0/233
MGVCRKVVILFLIPVVLSFCTIYFEAQVNNGLKTFPSLVRQAVKDFQIRGKKYLKDLLNEPEGPSNDQDKPLPKPSGPKKTPSQGCCSRLKIEGTNSDDKFYQNIMGEYYIKKDLPFIKYEKIGKLSGSYPVYEHVFPNFVPTEEIPEPKKSYLYYYFNDHPQIQESVCPELGCWIISMYDPTPGNYWFGKKWYYILSNPVPKCPDNLTAKGSNVFRDTNDKVENNMRLTCLK